MSDRKCSPLLAGIVGFILGALVVKLAARFCPFCRTDCCCGDEADCCCDGSEASSQGCCCGDAADSPSGGEAEAPAE